MKGCCSAGAVPEANISRTLAEVGTKDGQFVARFAHESPGVFTFQCIMAATRALNRMCDQISDNEWAVEPRKPLCPTSKVLA